MQNIYMLFPNGKKKALTFSYDDAVHQDKRLVEIFNKYGMKATFNINTGWMPEFEDTTIKDTHRVGLKEITKVYEGHEVAVHGLEHPFLEQLPTTEIYHQINDDKRNIEKITGKVIRGMAYPFGTYNDDVIRIAKDIGIAYSRTVYSTHNFDIPEKWLELHPTCHHDDEQLFDLGTKFLNENPSVEWTKSSRLFYVWGHAYEFDNNNNWDRIEKFCEMMGKKEDIWYATNIEIYDYITAYKSLRFGAELTYVENPTSTDIWVVANGKTVKIPSGNTVKLY